MKTLIIIALFAVVTFAQSTRPAAYPVERDAVPYAMQWKLITEGGDSRWYFQKWKRNAAGDAEVWLKQVPDKPVKMTTGGNIFTRKVTTRYVAYVLEFAAFHCADDRYTIESMSLFNAAGVPVLAGHEIFLFRKPIPPGSVMADIASYFCR